ncbi:uncharacterized protein LOC26527192 isoform X2 [Drosophila mojavensis]|uniref:uncharacterized protein LOC26527192 isoform X2 n=1 Tax=Drosophila mojavensis TaxID=7230 RepID=UPI0013EE722C|nr:uncharacterized protein LOC26527192 isoform X2 [Drosophila mojavensis]
MLATASVQILSGLTSYSCTSPGNCLNPSTQVCSDKTANETSGWLNTIHKFVSVVESSRIDDILSFQKISI